MPGCRRWLINGKAYPDHPGTIMPPAHAPQIDPIRVHEGGRYRLIFRNQSDDARPIHLHRRQGTVLTPVRPTPTVAS